MNGIYINARDELMRPATIRARQLGLSIDDFAKGAIRDALVGYGDLPPPTPQTDAAVRIASLMITDLAAADLMFVRALREAPTETDAIDLFNTIITKTTLGMRRGRSPKA